MNGNTLQEIAAHPRPTQACQLAPEGLWPGFKVGRTWHFRRSSINGWIRTQATKREAKNGH